MQPKGHCWRISYSLSVVGGYGVNSDTCVCDQVGAPLKYPAQLLNLG